MTKEPKQEQQAPKALSDEALDKAAGGALASRGPSTPRPPTTRSL